MAENSTNSFVIDSSFILAYLLPDENSTNVQQFFDRFKIEKISLLAPCILPFEVFNGLQTAVLQKRIKLHLAEKLGKKFLMIPIELVDLDFITTLILADKYKLTFYDASYLYLSKQKRASLLSLDKKLKDLTF